MVENSEENQLSHRGNWGPVRCRLVLGKTPVEVLGSRCWLGRGKKITNGHLSNLSSPDLSRTKCSSRETVLSIFIQKQQESTSFAFLQRCRRREPDIEQHSKVDEWPKSTETDHQDGDEPCTSKARCKPPCGSDHVLQLKGSWRVVQIISPWTSEISRESYWWSLVVRGCGSFLAQRTLSGTKLWQ